MVVLFLLIGCLSPRDQPPVPQRAKQARLSTEEDAMRSKAVEKIVTIIPTRTASLGWNKKPWIVEITLQLSCYYCFMKEEHRFTFQGPLNSSRCILWPHRNTKSLYTNFRLDLQHEFTRENYCLSEESLKGTPEGVFRGGALKPRTQRHPLVRMEIYFFCPISMLGRQEENKEQNVEV